MAHGLSRLPHFGILVLSRIRDGDVAGLYKRRKSCDLCLLTVPVGSGGKFSNIILIKMSCSFVLTVQVDVTRLKTETKKRGIKFYPARIFALASVVNQLQEFRFSLNERGNSDIGKGFSPFIRYSGLKRKGFPFYRLRVMTIFGNSKNL